ncbi:hypothetical protein KAI92_02560 [Candidatus Parcubacteria bacterium]|nr:hypothetical protein [Candidatus Parcubacteria bacterium]
MEKCLNQNKNIKEAIIHTIAFFDMFKYPLTTFEIWRYLPIKCGYFEVEEELEKICYSEIDDDIKLIRLPRFARNDNGKNNKIKFKDGFYFLRERQRIVKTRKKRHNITDKKFKRAILITRIFKIIPWIRMIAIGNLIGSNNLRDESDIDLFIITQKNRIWITRFFTVLIIKFLGVRPKINNTKNKICLSFFISEDNLDMENLRIENDIYFTYWLANLTPIFDINCYYDKLIKENSWLIKKLPNWQKTKISNHRNIGKPFSEICSKMIDIIIGSLEKTVKKYQLKILPDKLKRKMNKDKSVIINDKILKLIPNDKRGEFRDVYEKNISKI